MGALSYQFTMQPIQADTKNFKTILFFVCAFNEGGFYALNVLCSCKQKILEHFAFVLIKTMRDQSHANVLFSKKRTQFLHLIWSKWRNINMEIYKPNLYLVIQLPATPWTAADQAPPSMGFSRQEYWSGVPLPSPIIYKKDRLYNWAPYTI